MLEKIIQKFFMPAAFLALSFIPSKAFSYASFVNVNGKEYVVAVDDDNPIAQVTAENKCIALESLRKAYSKHEVENLGFHVNEMTKNAIESVWGPVNSAEELANKINYVERLLAIKNAKIPWWPLCLKSPEEFKVQIIALEDVWQYRKSAYNIIEASKREQFPETLHKEVCKADKKIQNMALLMKNLGETQKTPADIVKNQNIEFAFEGVWKSFNLDKAEDIVNDVGERYKLRNMEVEKLKAETKQMIDEMYNNTFHDEMECKSLDEILNEFKIILEPPEPIFSKNYSIPLFTTANPKFQTPKGRENASLDIKVEKCLKQPGKYYLQLWMTTDKTFNKRLTSAYLFYPQKSHISRISQKAYNFKIKDNEKISSWEEIYPDDMAADMQFEIVDSAFDSAVLKATRGITIRVMNVFRYLGDKIYDYELSEDSRDMDKILIMYNDRYKAKRMIINPINELRQTQGYLLSIPVSDENKDDILLYLNLAFQSGRIPSEKGYGSPNEEAFGRLEDIAISVSKGKQIPEHLNQKENSKNLLEFLESEEKKFEKTYPSVDYEYRIIQYNEDTAKVFVTQTSKIKKSAYEAGKNLLNSNPSDSFNPEIYEKEIVFSFNIYLKNNSGKWAEREDEIKEYLADFRGLIDEYKSIKGRYPPSLNLEGLTEDEAKNLKSAPAINKLLSDFPVQFEDFIYENGKVHYKNHLNW